LIDAEKTYNIIDEIRAKQAQKTKFFMIRKQKSPEKQKWGEVLQFMQKNPQTLVNMLPTPPVLELRQQN
jgi:hypothetical protein